MMPLKPDNKELDLAGHDAKIKSLIFSQDGKSLYSSALDGKVLKWDLSTGKSSALTDGSIQIVSIDITSGEKYLAGITAGGSVIIWDPGNISDKFVLETTGKNIKTIRFNQENNFLATGDINGNVEIWDIMSRKQISLVKAHDAQINDIQFNKAYNQMATAGNDKKLKIFNLENLTEPPITFTDNESFVLVMKFSTDGKLIVSGGYEGTDNLMGRPTHVDYFIDGLCSSLARNMTQEEWNTYVARDIPLEQSCAKNNFSSEVSAIK
jgi:WD40 repeat protein